MKFFKAVILFLITILISNVETQSMTKNNLFFFSDSISQTDTTLADKYFKKAKELIYKGKKDSIIYYFNKSVEIYESGKQWEKLVDIYRQFATSFIPSKENISTIKKYFNRAFEIGNEKLSKPNLTLARAYSEMGKLYYHVGNWDMSFKYYKKSLNIYESILGNNNVRVAFELANIAINYERVGEHSLAKLYFQKSLKIFLANYSKEVMIENNGFWGIYVGYIYVYLEEIDLALKYLKEQSAVSMKKENHRSLSSLYTQIAGIYYFNQKNISKGLEYFTKALNYSIKRFGENDLAATMYANLGYVYYETGLYDSAYLCYDKSLKIKLDNYVSTDQELILIYNQLGLLFEKLGNYEKSLRYYNKILNIYLANSMNIRLSIGSLINYSDIEPFKSKVRLLLKKYKEEKKDMEQLNEIYTTYELALEFIEKRKSYFGTDVSKIRLNERTNEIFLGAIINLLELYKLTQDVFYKKRIFFYAEKGKANVLFESLTESRAKKFSGIPDSLLKKEKELRIELTYYDTEFNKEKQKKETTQDTAMINRFEDEIYVLNIAYQDLLSKFEKDYPQYYNMKYKNDVLSVEDIQNRLDDETVLLEYFVGDSSLFIFTIDKDNYDIYSGTFPKDTVVNEFINSIYNFDTDKYLESGYLLYSKLIKPIEEKLKGKEVILIPDGILHYLPFEALLTKKVDIKTKVDYSSLPYLINDYTINYAYSATMAFSEITDYKPRIAKNGGLVGLAPVSADSTVKVDLVRREVTIVDTFNNDIYRTMKRSLLKEDGVFNPLPASEEEVKSIYKMFKEKNKPADIYLRSNATEEVIKSEKLSDYKYVHLATHAFVNESNPKLSGIVLSTDSQKKEDGILYSEEIYNLDFNADLIVLSACESGLGEVVKGEGIIGFTRGFMYSGVKNIIVSLWEVLDKSTSELMIKLYKKILSGKNYAKSLRESKLATIKSGQYSAPYFWAPFVLIGN